MENNLLRKYFKQQILQNILSNFSTVVFEGKREKTNVVTVKWTHLIIIPEYVNICVEFVDM